MLRSNKKATLAVGEQGPGPGGSCFSLVAFCLVPSMQLSSKLQRGLSIGVTGHVGLGVRRESSFRLSAEAQSGRWTPKQLPAMRFAEDNPQMPCWTHYFDISS